MGLQVHTTWINPSIAVVLLSGSITRCADPTSEELFVHDLLEHGTRRLILDLTCVEHIDSSGLQMMYACYSAVREAGGELRFVCANPRVTRLFEITGLISVLPFYPTVSTARATFTTEHKAAGS